MTASTKSPKPQTVEAGERLVTVNEAELQAQFALAKEKMVAEVRAEMMLGIEQKRPDLTGNLDGHPAGPSTRSATTRIINRALASHAGAPGVHMDGEWGSKSFGEFCRAISPANVANIRNDYSSIDPSSGGFLVPETLRSEVIAASLEKSVVRSRASVFPMPSARLGLPVADATSNASSVFGGMTAAWTEEGATLGESEAKFGRVVLDAKKLTSRTDVPNELLQDSSILDAFLMRALPDVIAWYEDTGFLTGTGAGEPLGAIATGNPSLVTVTKETGQINSTIVWENIGKMYQRMLPGSVGSAIWLAHPGTFAELSTMALSVGTGGAPVWLNSGITDAPISILGRPLIFTEKVPALGSAGDLSFVDFSWYAVGDRSELRIESSIHAQFAADITVFRAIERVDGRPLLLSAITPANGSDTLSPFVRLGARA